MNEYILNIQCYYCNKPFSYKFAVPLNTSSFAAKCELCNCHYITDLKIDPEIYSILIPANKCVIIIPTPANHGSYIPDELTSIWINPPNDFNPNHCITSFKIKNPFQMSKQSLINKIETLLNFK